MENRIINYVIVNLLYTLKTNEGLNIFNLEVPTQRLKFRILDQIQVEPPWAETEKCQITDEKFGMRLRKHHCRHCGRCVCEKERFIFTR